METTMVSCLCVTDNRPAFMAWLLWNFDRQTWQERELIIVDSSAKPYVSNRDNVRVIAMPQGTNVPTKRNRAIEAAQGEIVTWFDDDDWQHPSKLEWLVAALANGAIYAGGTHSWFVNLDRRCCTPYQTPKQQIVFNSAGFRREAITAVSFPTQVQKASDTRWMQALKRKYPSGGISLSQETLFFWLCHRENLSNSSKKRHGSLPLSRLREQIGTEAWGDTNEALEALQMRIDRQQSGKEAVSQPQITSIPTQRDHTLQPPISVMVKATVMDVPYLDVMVRHMIAQAHYPFVERTVVVERRRAFSGKYRRRPQATDADLDQVLQRLLADDVIDRVIESDLNPKQVRRTLQAWFGQGAERVSSHAATGGPIFTTLYGLDTMPTEYVLQLDADIFFYTNGTSWVSQAVSLLQDDPSLWLMMTHPGPPHGPVGQSLGKRNVGRATWDATQQMWRFRHATTRYFLCHRQRLRGKLAFVPRRGQCAPLEQCISKGLQQQGAFRGALGDLQSWHLHAWHHSEPFPAWAASIAKTIEVGHYPNLQRGNYDLRLDRPSVQQAWRQVLNEVQGNPEQTEKTTILSTSQQVPIAVVIPIRNRAGQRVKNALASLNWQRAGQPAEIIVVSHGSESVIDRELAILCEEAQATLLTIGKPTEAWNKSLALNVGIRETDSAVRYVMTMDTDMLLAPDFFTTILKRFAHNPLALVLCRISDLPKQAHLPAKPNALCAAFNDLGRMTKPRPRSGSGGIQVAERQFFFDIRGYDEDLLWWGAMDGDMVNRAKLQGLQIEWIDDETSMLHQWHPRKHRILSDRHEIRQAKIYWRRNHQIVRTRAKQARRNSRSWGLSTAKM